MTPLRTLLPLTTVHGTLVISSLHNVGVGDDTAVALRMDDVGASSKRFEVYARALPLPGPAAQVGDWLFLKYLPPLRAWGPYRELRARDWTAILEMLRSERAMLTVAVTAAWVTWSGELIPFPERFPSEAALIKAAVAEGLVEVANHGLTHCVLDGHAFRPRLFSGNRAAHREFWDWISLERQRENLRRAQDILRRWLGADVVTFVPPGNVFGTATLEAARLAGLRVISCETAPRADQGLRIVGNDRVVAFHDRDVVLRGIDWLRERIRSERAKGHDFCFVRDLGG